MAALLTPLGSLYPLSVLPLTIYRCARSYWCIPQGQRTAAEKVQFSHMLMHANFLYLGTRVLILLDLSYISRFW